MATAMSSSFSKTFQTSEVVKFYVLVNRATAFKDPVTKSYKRHSLTKLPAISDPDIKLIVHIKARVIGLALDLRVVGVASPPPTLQSDVKRYFEKPQKDVPPSRYLLVFFFPFSSFCCVDCQSRPQA
ncbi:hypothetical protein CEXT_462711 [Caerostris extrusa]|uniref:Uncharacterized protein n=1 Tax=Caerostris extrusa TaxID=172846 RepID=A0AAV4YC12_CAEEX|nr:hypothetical protein CEXT_462711 [Caerostris extrusa]